MTTKNLKIENPKVLLKIFRENDREKAKIILPQISDEELWDRYKRIKPIVEYQDKYYNLKPYTMEMLRHHSFIHNSKNDLREQVDLTKAEVLTEFSCYHTYGYYGLFKPTIAEVLQQFPDEALLEANAFMMSQVPESITDLNEQQDIINLGCHKSKVKALILK